MRKYFLTGLATLLPIALTCMLFIYLIDLFTEPFLGLVRELLGEKLPFFSQELLTVFARMLILIGLFLFTFLLGVIARWFFFRTLLSLTHKILSKIPFVKTIYKVSKEIFSSFFSEKGREAFKYPAMINFPSEKSYCIGFVTGEVPEVCQKNFPESFTPCFVPTAPHPISGYILFVPDSKIKKIDITNEDAVKFTLSCGVIVPEVSK